MSITLGGVTLDDNLCWPDEMQTPAVAQSTYQTCGPGGSTHFQIYPTSISRMITLEAKQISDGFLGIFTREQVLLIKGMEGGPPVELNYEGRYFTVVILNTDFKARLERPNPDPSDLYYGTITMREV